MNNNLLYQKLEKESSYRAFLYRYGYLITDVSDNFTNQYSFIKTWKEHQVNGIRFLIHPDQKSYFHSAGVVTYFLIGHCYNPIKNVYEEDAILRNLADAYSKGTNEYARYLSELTGIFISGYINENCLTVYGDASGMLMAYYGYIGKHLWISSHADLLGNLNALEQSPYVKRLIQYRFYHLFGYSLPGDLSPYTEFKRLVPNHSLCMTDHTCIVQRFYPFEDWTELTEKYTAENRIEIISEILQNSMQLIPQKWSKPAISLTGGCDSKTTLACAAGYYDKYQYFSYISQESERVDAEGAHRICEKLGLKHSIYQIPAETCDKEEAELVRDIISANQGNIGKLPAHELQKRIFLSELDDFDVEVKSWVSEIGRAYYHKRFNKKTFPAKPTPHYLTALYKFFVHDRKLIQDTDRIFERYIQEYLISDQLKGWNWMDLLFWEFRVSSWNGLVITGEHRYSFDITIPYNNRVLLELLLTVPVEMRIQDTLYKQVRDKMNPAVDGAGVAITNLKHTSNRAKMERLYLELSTMFSLFA